MTVLAPELRTHFLELARAKCLPYLRELPMFRPFDGKLAFAVVGSVASGLCSPTSDIDLAVVMDEATLAELVKNPDWTAAFGEGPVSGPVGWGRPCETTVEGVPVQFYCVTYEHIQARLDDLRDSYIYHYGNSVPLYDPDERYGKLLAGLKAAGPELRRQRLEGKLDMLRRRYAALEASLRLKDVMAATQVALELLTLGIKVTALIDDVPFDPRKRLFFTGLAGRLGYQIEGSFRQLIAAIAEFGQLEANTNVAGLRFPSRLVSLINVLSDEARAQGFKVGLDKPDPRCSE